MRNFLKRLRDRMEHRRMERMIVECINGLAISHFVDIGANHGARYMSLRKKGYSGHYTAVEPNPVLAGKLKSLLAPDPRAGFLPVAVAGKSGKATLFSDPRFDVLSSLHAASEDMNKGVEFSEKHEVKVRRTQDLLSDLMRQQNSADPRFFLKIDTQGHDYDVLSGIGKNWSHVFAVMTEMSAIPLYEGQAPHWKSMKLLEEKGFVPVNFVAITRRRENGIVLIAEYDALFVRRHSSPPQD